MGSNEEEPMDLGVSEEDSAELEVSLWSPEEIEPKKFRSIMTKTLTSWASKNGIRGDFTVSEISADGRKATITVKPPEALQELLNLNGKQLSSKEKKIFSINILPNQSRDDMKTSATQQMVSEDVEFKVSTENDNEKPCLVALGPYWYIKNLYPEKIQSIEKENGVKITENVAVTICPEKKAANLQKASEDFIRLVQTSLGESSGLSIPLKKVGAEEWNQTLKYLRATDHKCQLTISSDEIRIFGPPQYQRAISKSLLSTKIETNFSDQEKIDYNESGNSWMSNFNDLEKYDTKRVTGFAHKNILKEDHFGSDVIRRQVRTSERERKSSQGVTFTTSIKDPFVSDGLPVEEDDWIIIKSRYQKELDIIEEKFNVSFREASTTGNKKVVKAHHKRSVRNMSMESHAIRALLRLYQKVAMSQLRPTNGSYDDEQDLYQRSNKANGETGKERGENMSSAGLEEQYKKPRQKPSSAESKEEEKEEETCPVCMDTFKKKTALKCKHEFCEECLERSVKSQGAICPVCKDVFGTIVGDQPHGTMTWNSSSVPLPGFYGCGTIVINYNIPNGTQTDRHPNPGQQYCGATRTAYLPDNEEGKEVLKLLKKAFDQKLIFTVGTSRTSGVDNVVTWNDIHHKTSIHGGPQSFGYPDPTYLSRVKDELKAKGVK